MTGDFTLLDERCIYIKAVIFDLDGTLLNTLDDIGESANDILSKHGLSINPISEYAFLTGNGAKTLFKRASHGIVDEEKILTMVNDFHAIYKSRCTSKTKIYNGIEDLLLWLNETQICCSVLSNKSHDITNLIIRHYFKHIDFTDICGQQANVPLKPDPTQILNMASKLQCSHEEIMFVGDTCVDMQAAKNAGIFAVGVLWGFRDKNELLNNGADAIAESPQDIKELIVAMQKDI